MLRRPIVRRGRSPSWDISAMVRRVPAGLAKGMMPSITRTSPSADRKSPQSIRSQEGTGVIPRP
jgi:hypothetical protein